MEPKRTKEFYERMNRVNEKLAETKLSENDGRYCWALFRKTFGYGKYEDRISRSQFAEMTGILEVNISRSERRLKKRNIIYENGKTTGFNLDIGQWEKVSLSIPFQKVSIAIQKGIDRAEKKGIAVDTYKETTKKATKKGRMVYKKLSKKGIDKLEKIDWFRAIMYNTGRFPEDYIDDIIGKYKFNKLMNCWYIFVEAKNVYNKIGFFNSLLDKHQED